MSASFGEVRAFTQENGPGVQLKVFGDEFYARYETTDGYTCIYDAGKGLYCYTALDGGSFVSTGIPISESPPPGARAHLKETPGVRNTKFDEQFGSISPPRLVVDDEAGPEIYGPNDGLLEGRQLNKGQVCGLAIIVDFQDVQTTITPEEVSAFLNAENYKANGNYCSVREYFQIMSSGALDYNSVVVGPVRLSQKQRYYVDHSPVTEALTLASATGLDLSQFDSRGVGAIDAVSILYAGDTVWEGQLWPHNSTVQWRLGPYRANMYQITGLGRQSSGLVIGTYCHESGHMLCRFPDLYDYGKRDGDFEHSAGMGVYCLMSSGNHVDGGRTPAPVCAYLRYLAGWCPNVISLNMPGIQQAVHGAYDTIYIYNTDRSNEYFLVENRGRHGLDAHLPSNGLAVYHCDTEGSNERQTGTEAQHYQCSLLQADGRLDLEENANQGGANDFFTLVQGEALSSATTPSSKLWDGSDSGLRIADIRETDETITFFVVPGRITMDGNTTSADLDPKVLEHLQQQKDIIQANLELFKLTQQMEQEKLKAELDKIRLEADRQKVETDKVKALIPSGATQALAGETKIEGKFGYLSQMAANEAMKNAALEIAKQVRGALPGGDPAGIVLVDSLDFCGDDIQVIQLSSQVDAMLLAMTDQAAEIDRLLKSGKLEEDTGAESFIAAASLLPVLGQVLASAPGAISWAADIASFFRSEDTYKSVETQVSLSSLKASVADALVEGGVKTAVKPPLSVSIPNFHGAASLTSLPILSNFMECSAARQKLSGKAAELRIRVDALTKDKDIDLLPETKAAIRLAEAACAVSKSLVQSFDDFSKLVNAVPKGKSFSPLALAAMREYLKKGDGRAMTHLLYLNIVSSGGEIAIRKTLWWDRDIVFIGGCLVTYVLADLKGNILAANTLGKATQATYEKGQDQKVRFTDLAG